MCIHGGAQARSHLLRQVPEGRLSIAMMKVIILGSLSRELLPLLLSFGSLREAVPSQSGSLSSPSSCVAWKLLDHPSEEETNRDVIRAWVRVPTALSPGFSTQVCRGRKRISSV